MRRGFTVLEMIVATLIMGIAIVGMLSGLSGASRNAARLMDHDRAVQLARAKMNELIVDRYVPSGPVLSGAFDPAQAAADNAGWRARVTPFEKPAALESGLLLDRIELEVWWMSGRDRRTFTLEGFRIRPTTRDDYPPEGPPQ